MHWSHAQRALLWLPLTRLWALRMVFMVTCLHMCSLAQGLWNSSQHIHLNSTLTFQGNCPVLMVHTCHLLNWAAEREGKLLDWPPSLFSFSGPRIDNRLFPCHCHLLLVCPCLFAWRDLGCGLDNLWNIILNYTQISALKKKKTYLGPQSQNRIRVRQHRDNSEMSHKTSWGITTHFPNKIVLVLRGSELLF